MRVRGVIAALTASAMLLVACGEEIEFVSLDVGQCFANPDLDGSGLMGVDVVDCDESHVGEVFHVVTMPDGDYPGEAAIDAQALDECSGPAFESYVGTDYNESELYAVPVHPTAESWEAGDRDVLCVAVDGTDLASASSVEGSVRGSGR